MLKIYLLWPGKTKEKWLQTGIEFYLKRLKNYYQVKLIATRASKGSKKRRADILKTEAAFLKKALPAHGYKVALAVEGKPMTSRGLASFLKGLENAGERNLTFVIGGPYGLSGEFLNECNFSLRLSRMTFTHEMSRLILLEQLYRASSINAGSPYHH